MPRDLDYLIVTVIPARQILKYVAGMTYEQFVEDSLTQDAVMHQITMMGEAVRRITGDFQENQSHIPWMKIRGMRNRLVHDYTEVKLEIVWDVVSQELPKYIEQVLPLIPPADRPE